MELRGPGDPRAPLRADVRVSTVCSNRLGTQLARTVVGPIVPSLSTGLRSTSPLYLDLVHRKLLSVNDLDIHISHRDYCYLLRIMSIERSSNYARQLSWIRKYYLA